jgi:hypothetical protein
MMTVLTWIRDNGDCVIEWSCPDSRDSRLRRRHRLIRSFGGDCTISHRWAFPRYGMVNYRGQKIRRIVGWKRSN